MKLKASKEYLLLSHIICLVPIMVGIVYLIYGCLKGEKIGFILFMLGALLICSISLWCVDVASYLRIIEMDALGCKISWLWWKREYLWNDFEIISKDIWRKKIRKQYGNHYYVGIFFQKKDEKEWKRNNGG